MMPHSVPLSGVCYEECAVAARSVGLSTLAWIEATLFRIARAQGMPAGVIDPAYEPKPPPALDPTALERIAKSLERIEHAIEPLIAVSMLASEVET